jgi:hypothetical protein
MNPESQLSGSTVHRFDAINYVATDNLARDTEQSHRLHEPEYLITTIDPITGRDITDLAHRPQHVDGNVTMYFESKETRQAYLDTPIDHPFHLVDNPDEEGEAEG